LKGKKRDGSFFGLQIAQGHAIAYRCRARASQRYGFCRFGRSQLCEFFNSSILQISIFAIIDFEF
jgi:hypothetical protein